MDDDWRLQIDLHEHGFAHRLGERLRASELEHDLERSFHDRVIVSVDGATVFLYAAERSQAEAAERVVRRIADEHGWELGVELRRWHPIAELWEDPENPLPGTHREASDEREIRIAGERRESAEQGYPEFEVRIDAGSRQAAREVVERLRGEGLPSVQRWSYVLVGAADEALAERLAERLRGELPELRVSVEVNPIALWDGLHPNPFAVLSGIVG